MRFPVSAPPLAIAAGDAVRSAGSFVSDLFQPTLRLGVTGLARAGKTVFITALVKSLLEGGRLPFFAPYAQGRVLRAWLEPQPDDAVPRFEIEAHLAALARDPPVWPDSTRRISQLRVMVEYRPVGRLRRTLGERRLAIDIVDYPGEWLIDLPMLDQTFADWSREALELARDPARAKAAELFLAFLDTAGAPGADREQTAIAGARLFTDYLRASRAGDHALSTAGPGRFLMPGDLEGSPVLTFFPLPDAVLGQAGAGPLAALLARRYESYKSLVVRPFFRDHFLRLDRQIVLVDALAALNAGPAALADLERAMAGVLRAFRPGVNSWLSAILARRIDRLVFAATKADHLHSTSHDRLEALLRAVTNRAIARAEGAGAEVAVLAIAALRATREREARQGRDVLPCIVGVPLASERLGTMVFDGTQEAVIFPGDLPTDPLAAIEHGRGAPTRYQSDVNVIRFRPPRILGADASGELAPLPHIRLDRALDFLVGDRLA